MHVLETNHYKNLQKCFPFQWQNKAIYFYVVVTGCKISLLNSSIHYFFIHVVRACKSFIHFLPSSILQTGEKGELNQCFPYICLLRKWTPTNTLFIELYQYYIYYLNINAECVTNLLWIKHDTFRKQKSETAS